MRIAAFCDFYEDASRPLQLIVQTRPGELDWSKTLYIPVSGPFEPFAPEDFGDLPGVSVQLEDLVQRQEPPEGSGGSANLNAAEFAGSRPEIGIHLPKIATRHGYSSEIQRLVVQMDDVEEVLNYAQNKSSKRSAF